MYDFTAQELAELRKTTEETMQDVCNILHKSVTFDTMGDEIATYSSVASNVRCGYTWAPKSEQAIIGGIVTEVLWDGLLRLPTGTAVFNDDNIELLEHMNTTISGTTLRVVSPVYSGGAQLVLGVKRVEF